MKIHFHFLYNFCISHIYDVHTGINAEITYTIQTDTKNSSEYFHIDENEGTIYLKKSLDHETQQQHHFTIKVIDKGSPALSSSK